MTAIRQIGHYGAIGAAALLAAMLALLSARLLADVLLALAGRIAG